MAERGVCLNCGLTFEKTQNAQRYCSADCRKQFTRDMAKVRRRGQKAKMSSKGAGYGMEEILTYATKYHLTYGKAVVELEQKRRRAK